MFLQSKKSVKVVIVTPRSLQYLGVRAPEPVKKKVLEIMYSWTVRLPDETKIAEAYQMLKKQGECSTSRSVYVLCVLVPSVSLV